MMRTLISFVFILCLIFLSLTCESPLKWDIDQNPYISYQIINLALGKQMKFALVLPEVFDANQAYPILIAFPPGDQDEDMVVWLLEKYLLESSIQRNWIVISPIAVDGNSYYDGSEAYMPDLYNWIEQRYTAEGGKYHISGVSAGGNSAFRVAINDTSKCQSILVFPGYPVGNDFNKLNRLIHIPVIMYVGGSDIDFYNEMVKTRDELNKLGGQATLEIFPSSAHVIEGLPSTRIFDVLDGLRTQ